MIWLCKWKWNEYVYIIILCIYTIYPCLYVYRNIDICIELDCQIPNWIEKNTAFTKCNGWWWAIYFVLVTFSWAYKFHIFCFFLTHIIAVIVGSSCCHCTYVLCYIICGIKVILKGEIKIRYLNSMHNSIYIFALSFQYLKVKMSVVL